MSILLAFLSRAWPYILAAVFAGFLFYKAEHWCNSVCKDARAETGIAKDRAATAEGKLAELDRARIKQQEDWASATAAEELRGKRDADDRIKRFAAVRDRVSRDARLAAVRVSPDLDRVFRDTYAAAVPSGPAPVTESPVAADTGPTEQEVAQWSVEMYGWAAECKARVQTWEEWYQSLRSAN